MSSPWPTRVGLIALTETDSTMTEARRRATDIGGPTWITARRQTAAHGRRGRAWVFPDGNFAGTLILPVEDAPAQLALRSFVAALALFDALAGVTAQASRLSLKWPNDVLLNGGKIAGILLETLPQRGVAVGIGVNLVEAPETAEVEAGAVRPVSLAKETGLVVKPEEFASYLATEFARHEATFQTQGFAPIRTAWLDRAARLGHPITARTVTHTHHGTFETVDMTGALVLTTAKGRVSIPAADVYF